MEYDSKNIIEQLMALPAESPLPREGAFSLFYESFIDRDNSILLSDGSNYHVFYFTSYDIVEEVSDEMPGVFFESRGNFIRCIILFNPSGEQMTTVIALDMKDAEHRTFYENLKQSGHVFFHFISMLYGELHKMKSMEIVVSKEAFA
jgi:hypothetical protein